ncbi:MAG: PAS domain S-box protein [Actinomycetota bacterium]
MRLAQQFLPYGVAISSTAIALLFSLWLEPLLSPVISPLFYIAILVTAWYGSFRSGMVAVILSTLAINYFFLAPPHPFWMAPPQELLRLDLFLLVSLAINFLTSHFQASKKNIERLNQQLTQTNADFKNHCTDCNIQLEMALLAARMGLWDWDLVTGEIKWSPEHALLLGLEPGTFDGKYATFEASVHLDDREGLNQAIQQTLQTKSIYQHEFRVIWPDGSIHWVEARGHGFDNEIGQVVRMTGTIMNIDARKQAETLLHQQFKQQNLVMEISGRIRRSLNLQEILQTTVEEVRQFLQCDRALMFKLEPNYGGTVLVESVDPAWNSISSNHTYDPCVGKEYLEAFQQGLITAKPDIYKAEIAPCHREMLVSFQVRANLGVPIFQGENLWGLLLVHHCAAPREWQASEIELLRQLAAQVSIAIQQADLFEQVQTELRERQQTELTLKEREETLKLFFKYVPAGVAVFDCNLNYLMASQRWVRDYQLESVESIIGRAHYEIFPKIPDRWKQIHQRCLGGAIEGCEEDFFERENGNSQWIRWEIHPWYKVNEEIGGIILFSEDITPRKQAQIALEQLNTELEERVKERTAELTKVNNLLIVTLREKEQAYQRLEEQAQLLDLAHDAIITWDLNSVITFWNQGAELMYGWDKAEALGQEVHSFLKTQFPQPVAEIEAQLLKKGYWEGELIHFSRDDRSITVASRWVLQKDEAGQSLKILEINNDITQHKQAELALQEYSRQVEDLYNNAPCGYHSIDAEGTIVQINNTELNWLGYTRDEVLNKKKFLEFMTPESQRIFYQNFPIFKQQGSLNNAEFEVLNKEGKIRWINLNATTIKDKAGNFLMSRSTLFDITERKHLENERKQAEINLRISQSRFAGILELASDAIISINPNQQITLFNKGAEQIFGYESEEVLGQPLTMLMPLRFAEVYSQQVSQSISNKYLTRRMTEQKAIFGRRKDGTEFPAEVSISKLESDSEVILTAFLRDITTRQQAEEALLHQKELFQTIVDHIPVMIALFNEQGQIEFINPEMERILGWSLADWQQKNILAECYPDPVECQSVVENMLSTTGKWQDLTPLNASGQRLQTSWANVRLSNGKSLGIGQDISERKHTELALRQAMEAAEAANLAKSIFLANMSHELRTPLNVILGFAQVMTHDSCLTPNQQEDLQTIRRSGDHLLSLIDDVLDLSKIEAGHCTVEESSFDLITLLHSLRNMFAERASSKGLDLIFEIAPDVPRFIFADAQKLRQVLLNLLSNAIKFTKQGSIRLQVSNKAASTEAAPTTQTILQFVMADTGVGIASEELNTIFDAFVQAQAGKRSTSGTGLGLTISRKLLELMGGEIAVRSTPGQGSTFSFTLPVTLSSGVNITPEPNDRLVIGLAPSQPHYRILVVDDHAENRLLMVRLLTQLGLEVKEASNGQEAVNLWQEWLPDLIWMDLRMPVLDGYEATQQIRARAGGHNCVIIALTAQVSQRDRALAAGCNDYISKPFREQTLFLKMSEYLGLKYLYEEEEMDRSPGSLSSVASPLSNSLDPMLLATLPEAWLAELENAAVCGNDVAIAELADQLSPEYAHIGTHLTELAKQYQFEQILKLIESNFTP